jgi:hypothetical protein
MNKNKDSRPLYSFILARVFVFVWSIFETGRQDTHTCSLNTRWTRTLIRVLVFAWQIFQTGRFLRPDVHFDTARWTATHAETRRFGN